jgi:DNA polymerase
MAIRGEEGGYSLFVRHDYFLSPRSLCQTFPISPASTGMMAHSRKDAASPQLPLLSLSLKELAKQAKNCRNCDLWRNATQTVFGEGSPPAPIMLVGEQPGDQEDLQGKPFVGPAGKLLQATLKEAGVDPKQVYLTNVVKHFKWEPRGKRRIHKKPGASEIAACRPSGWMQKSPH